MPKLVLNKIGKGNEKQIGIIEYNNNIKLTNQVDMLNSNSLSQPPTLSTNLPQFAILYPLNALHSLTTALDLRDRCWVVERDRGEAD